MQTREVTGRRLAGRVLTCDFGIRFDSSSETGVVAMLGLGKTSKFNFCGPSFPHSLTKSNFIVSAEVLQNSLGRISSRK